jgi:hypothetical protein
MHWHMLATGELYNDLGGDYIARRDPERQTRRLVAQLERLGHRISLQKRAGDHAVVWPASSV